MEDQRDEVVKLRYDNKKCFEKIFFRCSNNFYVRMGISQIDYMGCVWIGQYKKCMCRLLNYLCYCDEEKDNGF
jgi:hypothetical protein